MATLVDNPEPEPTLAQRQVERHAVLQDENVDRANTEQDQGMAVQAIGQAAPAGQRAIFLHGESRDIPDAAPVEVSRGCVVDRVRPPPVVVRRQGEHPDRTSEHVVGAARPKERAVPAIVLNDEQADQEQGRGHREQQCDPIAVPERQPHAEPQQGERTECDQHLRSPARRIGVSVCLGARGELARREVADRAIGEHRWARR